MFSSPGRSTIRVKRGSDVRKTNEAIETSVYVYAVQITLHRNNVVCNQSACKVVNAEIGRAR